MKFVITGSVGNIGKPLAEQLIAAGHDVTIITSDAGKKAQIEGMGAKAAVGKLEDVPFLAATFKGADAVYTMVPPKWDAADWKDHIHQVGRGYAEAIKAAGVKKVVNLSSVGAHLADKCGPVNGLHRVEGELNKLDGVAVKHLRPAFFYTNLLANTGMVKHMGIIGGNYGENTTMVMVHPRDIAAVAAEELMHGDVSGKSVRYIASDERNVADIAGVIGAAIDKSSLPWVNFKDEDAYKGMLQAGLSQEVAKNYVEMGAAIADGTMNEDYAKHKAISGKVKLEDFAKEFAAVYAQA